MEGILDLQLDSFLNESFDIDSYMESSEFVDILNALTEAHDIISPEMVINEEVKSNSISLKRDVEKTIKNTIDTTKTANAIAGEVSNAEAGIFKATWDLFAKCAHLVGKFIAWIFGIIEKIPSTLLKIIDKITDIPGNIKAKIRGDIKLYITVKDIESLYANSDGYTLMGHLIDYINDGNKLISIDTFTRGGLFSSREEKQKSKEEARIEKNLIWLNNHLRAVEFKQTLIDLSKEENRNIYLSNKPVVTILGKQMSYKDAINLFCDDIKKKKDEIGKIKTEYAKMMADPDVRESMSKLSTWQCSKLNELSNTTISVFTFISDVLKYIMTDIKTLNKAIAKLDKKNEKDAAKAGKAAGKADKSGKKGGKSGFSSVEGFDELDDRLKPKAQLFIKKAMEKLKEKGLNIKGTKITFSDDNNGTFMLYAYSLDEELGEWTENKVKATDVWNGIASRDVDEKPLDKKDLPMPIYDGIKYRAGQAKPGWKLVSIGLKGNDYVATVKDPDSGKTSKLLWNKDEVDRVFASKAK